jgi:hypothetical protein
MDVFNATFENQKIENTIRLQKASFDDEDIAVFLIQWGSSPKNVGLIRGTINTRTKRLRFKEIEWDWVKGNSGWYEGGGGDLKQFDQDFQDNILSKIFGDYIRGANDDGSGMFITGKRTGDKITSSSNLMAWFVYAPAAEPASADTGKKEKEAEVIDEQAKEAEEEADAAEKEADDEAKKTGAKPADVKEKQDYASVARANSEKLLEKAKNAHEYDIFYTEFNTPATFSAEFIKSMDKYQRRYWHNFGSSWNSVVTDPTNHVHYVDGKTLVWGIKYEKEKTYYFAKELAKSLSVFTLGEEAAGDIKPGWVFPSAVRFDTRRKTASRTSNASGTVPKTDVEKGIQSLRDQLTALTLRLDISSTANNNDTHTQLKNLRDKIKRTASLIERDAASLRRVYV